jgi:hypothetical protein
MVPDNPGKHCRHYLERFTEHIYACCKLPKLACGILGTPDDDDGGAFLILTHCTGRVIPWLALKPTYVG